MICASTVFDVYLPKVTTPIGAVVSETDLSVSLPLTYAVDNDVTETASSVTTQTIYSQTADGEAPQKQCVTEQQASDDKGRTMITPGVKVTVVTNVAGVDTELGVTGFG